MPRRVLEGSVVSAKMDRTIVVEVKRRYMHPLYKKFVTTSKKYHADAPNGSAAVGDTVRIIEAKPVSKTKAWALLRDAKAPKETAAKTEAVRK
jgi:small subunit ribosomal protein S17